MNLDRTASLKSGDLSPEPGGRALVPDTFRKVALENYDISFGSALGKLKGTIFRIGHLGDFNDLMLMGTLAGVEMGLRAAGVPHKAGGVQAAMDSLARERALV